MSELQKFMNEFTAIAAVLGLALGYLVKLRWSREYEKTMKARVSAAEEAQTQLLKTWQEKIKAVQDAHKEQLSAANERRLVAEDKIQSLMTLTPEKILKEFEAMKSLYEERICGLNQKLNEALAKLEEKSQELLNQKATIGRFLRERLENEKRSYEKEVAFLKAQIGELKERERVLVKSIELLRRKPFEEDMVESQLKKFSTDRILAKIRYEDAQKGVHAGVADYMNAHATAKVEAEKREERKLSHRAEIPDEYT